MRRVRLDWNLIEKELGNRKSLGLTFSGAKTLRLKIFISKQILGPNIVSIPKLISGQEQIVKKIVGPKNLFESDTNFECKIEKRSK